jgi:hypothetical protein
LQALVEKKSTRDVLASLDPGVRDMVLTLLTIAARVHDNELEKAGPQESDRWLVQLRHLSAALRGRAPLVLNKLCFCRAIEGFGAYDAVAADHAFQAGELVYAYVEVRNFLSQCTPDPRGLVHEIDLAGTLEILDFHRDVVYHKEFTVADRSLTPRQDYFINYPFSIPAMPAGPYTLRVTLRDGSVSTGGIARMARQTLDFRVTSR